MQVQEDIEQRTMSVTVQATKLSGRVLKAAIAAALQKMEQNRNTQHETADRQGPRRQYH